MKENKWLKIRRQMAAGDFYKIDAAALLLKPLGSEDILEFKEVTRFSIFYEISEQVLNLSDLMRFQGTIGSKNKIEVFEPEREAEKPQLLTNLRDGWYYIYKYHDLLLLIKSRFQNSELFISREKNSREFGV